MKSLFRNILVCMVGLFAGGLINMLLVATGPLLIPVPAGLDMSTPEGIRRSLPELPVVNFLFPWLAHAAGTLSGACIASRFAAGGSAWPAMVIGLVFLSGGLAMILIVGGPGWFLAVDLLLAYIPMAWLGHSLCKPKASN
ncbi:MAG: hypothetical protein ACKOEO_12715 [Planctomycetaceae bacterium]